ncbi:MAG: sugar phosphate isomerase/epimerase family protein [Mycobacterium sp.]
MRNPKFSICEFTTPDTTFEDDLEIYRSVGATGIGISEDKLRDGEDDEQLAAFERSGLAATVCLPTNIGVLPVRPALAYPGPEQPEDRIRLMCSSIRRLSRFDPDCIVVITGSEQGYSHAEAEAIVTAGLQEAADVAAEHGTRLALEPCRGDLGFDGSFLRSLQSGLDMIEAIDRPNVGLCYDVYHHWHEDDIVSATEKSAARVFGVQLNDWREPPRCNTDRVLPGDGVIDIPALLAALERGGFDGWYDLEIFSDDGRWGTDLPDSLWKRPPIEVAQAGMDAMKHVWHAAGSIHA